MSLETEKLTFFFLRIFIIRRRSHGCVASLRGLSPQVSRSASGSIEAEGRALTGFGVKIKRAIVQLHGAIGEGETDSAAGLLGGEVEIKNFIANLGRNPSAGVVHLKHGGLGGGEAAKGEGAAFGHGLHAVDHHVEHGLLDEVGVDADGQRLRAEILHDFDLVGAGFGCGEGDDLGGQGAQIERGKLEIDGAGEVDQGFNHAVEAMDLRSDDIHVAARLGIELEDALAQNLQVDDDGVDGIFDLVGDAGGQASDGGEAARELDLIFNAADGLGIAHGEQRADGTPRSEMKSSES